MAVRMNGRMEGTRPKVKVKGYLYEVEVSQGRSQLDDETLLNLRR